PSSTTPSPTASCAWRAVSSSSPTEAAGSSSVTATAGVKAGAGVSLQGLTKSFAGERGPVHAVRGIDVAIEPGETVALLGPNGAGRSTTIDMMLGLLEPDSGSAGVFGASPSDAVASGRIGAMLQTGALIRDLTVRELITMVASLYPEPLGVDETIAQTGIEEIADRLTQKLSGGETQRARFAA